MGPACNLSCAYCFYTEKEALFSRNEAFGMSNEVLEQYIKNYIMVSGAPEVSFVWQGGEPTLRGLDFFRKAVQLQEKYAGNKRILNSLQTNGTLLDDNWGKFLKEHDFLVGISIDGPERIHDRYRLDKSGRGSFQQVMKGLSYLRKYEIPFNALCCVTRESAYQAKEIYDFFREQGIAFIQFIPIVERARNPEAERLGLRLGCPASREEVEVTDWSVEAEAYGAFLIQVFDQWVRKDVGQIHVMNFEWALSSWMGLPSTVCVFAKECGSALVVEHDGSVYSCDHYVYPEHRLGNLMTDRTASMIQSDKQKTFGMAKKEALPRYCRNCPAEFACHGECPKHRFIKTPDGKNGLNYLCAGYQKYFRHIHPYMKAMRQLIENGLPAAKVMEAVKGPFIIKKA